MLQRQSLGFQPVHYSPSRFNEWSTVNNIHPHYIGGYGKGASPRIVTFPRATQNTESEKKEPSNGSWDQMDIITELKNQSKKKLVDIEVGAQNVYGSKPLQ